MIALKIELQKLKTRNGKNKKFGRFNLQSYKFFTDTERPDICSYTLTLDSNIVPRRLRQYSFTIVDDRAHAVLPLLRNH